MSTAMRITLYDGNRVFHNLEVTEAILVAEVILGSMSHRAHKYIEDVCAMDMLKKHLVEGDEVKLSGNVYLALTPKEEII